MSFLTTFVNGLSLGSIYAIIALGYTMVYGIAKMLNFAHGDFIMVGCYIIFMFSSGLGLPPFISIPIAVVLCTVLGVTTERVAYRPLRNAASPLAVLITAIGVSYFLENLALLIFGADTKSFSSVITWSGLSLFNGELQIQGITIVTIAVSLFILLVLQLFVHKTKEGQAMLAVSQDRGAAMLMGIDVNKTITLTFAIGSALAAVAGALLASAYPSLTPYTGAMPGIKAFVAAVLGGIGSIPGAMIGGLALGIIEILSRTYISSQLADAIVFGILVVVLLVKPTGILGKKIQEKV
ncbi:MAG: branched-chain amino acid ABC transporter permease [Lachnospiraceae bacterium]|nr:branched-chain amino acid ABC transporter permease [Lachnospiraceae bacterium]